MVCLEEELEKLSELAELLSQCVDARSRLEILNEQAKVRAACFRYPLLKDLDSCLEEEEEVIVKSLFAIGQGGDLFSWEGMTTSLWRETHRKMLDDLRVVERFYQTLGGIVGYHVKLLVLMRQKEEVTQHEGLYYHPPLGIDLISSEKEVGNYILEGMRALPLLAEMYPVGGAADRLRLLDQESGDPLPAARLEFCGYTLLEGLIRDLQAREYLYFRLFGRQVTTPVAMMTSQEKRNHEHILELCQDRQWFGRGEAAFRFFCQPLVPALDLQGKWCLSGPCQLLMKPGGHGVLWKTAQDSGVFGWMQSLGCQKVLVRQINNPVAGIDGGLLAFCGVGFAQNKQFGFSSCFRRVSSAEGVNVLIEKKEKSGSSFCLTNIEYCDFSKNAIQDVPIAPGVAYSRFPSNTNILFADIKAVQEVIEDCPIPGMLVNTKQIAVMDSQGVTRAQEVIRLESTMQNLADSFEVRKKKEELSALSLPTFLTHQKRHKTISAIKKMYQGEGGTLLETPEGCFYDVLLNASELLSDYCHMLVPTMPSPEEYVEEGPSFLLFYHPALGPLFSVIGQKIRGGSLQKGSELTLEIAEVDMEDVHVSGVLQVRAEQVMGKEDAAGILRYGDSVGSCVLHHVRVENQGIDASAPNVYWKKEMTYLERCEICIEGDGEFYACGVTLSGAMRIEVKRGMRVIAFEEAGRVQLREEPLAAPKEAWSYQLEQDGSVFLA